VAPACMSGDRRNATKIEVNQVTVQSIRGRAVHIDQVVRGHARSDLGFRATNVQC